MNKRLLGAWHRWLFIFMGIFMLIWLVSGVVMSLPWTWFIPPGNTDLPAPDYSAITLSPAEAITRFEQHAGKKLDVKKVKIMQIDDGLYYFVRTQDDTTGHVNGVTGEILDFTPELATRLVRSKHGIEAPVQKATYLVEHTGIYPAGPLPVYRVNFEDKPSHYYYVNANSANIVKSSLVTRSYRLIVSLHAFEPMQLLPRGEQLRLLSLFITGMLSLIGTVIGVFLIFPLRRKRAR